MSLDAQSDLARQIEDELQAVADRLTGVLGLDLVDILYERARQRSLMLAAQLRSDEMSDGIAAETVIDLMCAIWPQVDPDPEWWRTPLGQACAASLGSDEAQAVSASVAASMLQITRARVYQLIDAGKLDRHPDGGVVRASVTRRLSAAR